MQRCAKSFAIRQKSLAIRQKSLAIRQTRRSFPQESPRVESPQFSGPAY